ncbi:MAG: hypothetical protein IIC10_02770 [Proteobacteria bacterium]|nr:hypothetical protein [Pseudomonadota bacterium]
MSADTQTEIFKAASLGMLDRHQEGWRILDALMAANAEFKVDPLCEIRRYFAAPKMMNVISKGLSKAGLQVELGQYRQSSRN